MSLGQLNIYGKDKVQVAIDRIKSFEPPEGYFLAFSGGKDSVCIKALADMAGVKYDAHYNVTTVDPPELVQFVKTFPDVQFDREHWTRDGKYHKAGDPVTMWNLIPYEKFPPTQVFRFCCKYLKERSGVGRFTMTGVRWAEGARRAHSRSGLEFGDDRRDKADPDNPDQELIHLCMMKKQRVLNPIIDWSDEDVWEFIKGYNLRYCKLYDEGFDRLGCIGCPMGRLEERRRQFERYPKIEQAYKRAIGRAIEARKEAGLEIKHQTVDEWFDWWMTKI